MKNETANHKNLAPAFNRAEAFAAAAAALMAAAGSVKTCRFNSFIS
jgi:hypothetical protein